MMESELQSKGFIQQVRFLEFPCTDWFRGLIDIFLLLILLNPWNPVKHK